MSSDTPNCTGLSYETVTTVIEYNHAGIVVSIWWTRAIQCSCNYNAVLKTFKRSKPELPNQRYFSKRNVTNIKQVTGNQPKKNLFYQLERWSWFNTHSILINLPYLWAAFEKQFLFNIYNYPIMKFATFCKIWKGHFECPTYMYR